MKLGKSKPPEVRGFLDDGTEIIGELKFSDVLHFHGRFKGRIISDGELIVGERGFIEGDVKVAILTLSGTLKGNIVATERVHMLKTCHVIGDVNTPILEVEEEASWEGTISTRPSHEESVNTEVIEELMEENQNVTTSADTQQINTAG